MKCSCVLRGEGSPAPRTWLEGPCILVVLLLGLDGVGAATRCEQIKGAVVMGCHPGMSVKRPSCVPGSLAGSSHGGRPRGDPRVAGKGLSR